MNIYIKSCLNRPVDDWGFIAYLGFSKMLLNIYFFEEIDEVPVHKNNLVVTWIDETKKYLEALGLTVPLPLNIPASLIEYCHREIKVMSLSEFKTTAEVPIFVKPYDKLKYFGAGVITQMSSKELLFHNLPDDLLVQTSEVIDIVSEYRGFVVQNELKSLNHYLGDFKLYPDCEIIEKAIKDYRNQPCGYSIDFGVTSSGQTVLIECNDGWSLGSYGCDPVIYARLLLKRWMEMTKFI